MRGMVADSSCDRQTPVALPAFRRSMTDALARSRIEPPAARTTFDRGIFTLAADHNVAGSSRGIAVDTRTAPDEWRVRLAGTELERRWGCGLTGLSYAEVLSSQAFEVTHREFDAICRQPCGSWSLRHLELRSGRRLQTETLRLPLRDKSGDITLIVSCSGELNPGLTSEPDQLREIVTMFEQQFFDLGAGIPDFRCAPDEITTPAPRPCC
jgi:hypothetical protein